MGNDNSAPEAPKYVQDYDEVSKEEHPFFGSIVHLRNRKEHTKHFLKVRKFATDQELQTQLKKANKRKQLCAKKGSMHILKTTEVSSSFHNELCGITHYLHTIYEDVECTLAQMIQTRMARKQPFTEQEIISILSGACNGMIFLQDNGGKNYTISKNSLAIGLDGVLKVLDEELSKDIQPYFKVFNGMPIQMGIYLAPELLNELKAKNLDVEFGLKSEVFSLGMTILEMCAFEPLDNLYNYNNFTLNSKIFEEKVHGLPYSQYLKNLISEMLEISEEERMGAVSLKEKLSLVEKMTGYSHSGIASSNATQRTHKISYVGKEKPPRKNKTFDLTHETTSPSYPSEFLNRTSSSPQPKRTQIYPIVAPEGFNFYRPNQSKQSFSPLNKGKKVLDNTNKIQTLPFGPMVPDQIQENISGRQISDVIKTENISKERISTENVSSERIMTQNISSERISTENIDTRNNPSKKYPLSINEASISQERQENYQAFPMVLVGNSMKMDIQGNQGNGNFPQNSSQNINKNISETTEINCGNIISVSTQSFAENLQVITSKDFEELNRDPRKSLIDELMLSSMNEYDSPEGKLRKDFESNNSTPIRLIEALRREEEFHMEENQKGENQKEKGENQNQKGENQKEKMEISMAKKKNYPLVDGVETKVNDHLIRNYGKYRFENGALYEGEMDSQGKFEGNGILYYPDSRVCYSGGWANNCFHGFGSLNNEHVVSEPQTNYEDFSQNPSTFWLRYEGEFSMDQKNGFGTLFIANGDKYSGCFSNDQVQGYGTFTSHTGQRVSGIWHQNKLRKL